MTKKIEPVETGVLGNTKTKTQVTQAKNWCFTLNNFTMDDINEILEKFKIRANKYIFEEEIGESGTLHLQGYVNFEKKLRPSELKLNKGIHWEKIKGTEQENINYCSKDFRENKTKNIYKSENVRIPRPLKLISNLKPWQTDLKKILMEEPDDRKIIWIYEKKGRVGKSAFSKFMVVKHDALYITEGKKSDVINIVYNYGLNRDLDIMLLDVPRDNKNNVSYKSLEEIKNGLICNTKYETGNIVINPPHIVVFSNSAPNIDKFSLDRWDIYKIKNDELTKNKKLEQKIKDKFIVDDDSESDSDDED